MTVAVMIMDDALLLQAMERMSEALSPCIVPIWKQDWNDLVPRHRGTGFLVEVDGHCFLISAAHVLDKLSPKCEPFCYLGNPPRYCWPHQRPLRLTDPPPGKTRQDDRIDVGVCYLGSPSSLPGVEQNALPIEFLKPAALPREEKLYMLAGLPGGSNQFDIDRRAKQATSFRATAVAPSRPAKVYQRCKVTPETHIVIEHTRDLRSKLSNRTGKFPKAGGMSGSPLWLVLEKGKEESDMKAPGVVVGVFIEYDGPRQALISTDIGEALKL